jgi:nitrate/nitrite-specific signal transduction histidine kinase
VGRAFRILIADNGCGIDSHHKKPRGGLSHMQTRASLIGASLRIESPVRGKGGTAVSVEFDPTLYYRVARPVSDLS